MTPPRTKEAMDDLRQWLVSLVEDMPDESLLKIVDAVEDAALTPDGDDPFYSEENMAHLRAAMAQMQQVHAGAPSDRNA